MITSNVYKNLCLFHILSIISLIWLKGVRHKFQQLHTILLCMEMLLLMVVNEIKYIGIYYMRQIIDRMHINKLL